MATLSTARLQVKAGSDGVDDDTDFWTGIVQTSDGAEIARRGGRGGPHDGQTQDRELETIAHPNQGDVEAGKFYIKVQWEPHGNDDFKGGGSMILFLTYDDGKRRAYDFNNVEFHTQPHIYSFPFGGPGRAA